MRPAARDRLFNMRLPAVERRVIPAQARRAVINVHARAQQLRRFKKRFQHRKAVRALARRLREKISLEMERLVMRGHDLHFARGRLERPSKFRLIFAVSLQKSLAAGNSERREKRRRFFRFHAAVIRRRAHSNTHGKIITQTERSGNTPRSGMFFLPEKLNWLDFIALAA